MRLRRVNQKHRALRIAILLRCIRTDHTTKQKSERITLDPSEPFVTPSSTSGHAAKSRCIVRARGTMSASSSSSSGPPALNSVLSPSSVAIRELNSLPVQTTDSSADADQLRNDSDGDDDDDDDDDDGADITRDSFKLTALVHAEEPLNVLPVARSQPSSPDTVKKLQAVNAAVRAILTEMAGKTPRIAIPTSAVDLCVESHTCVAPERDNDDHSNDVSVRMYSIDKLTDPAQIAKRIKDINGKTSVLRDLYPTNLKKQPMRFVTCAPEVLRTNPIPPDTRMAIQYGTYTFRLPLQDHATQREVGLLMQNFGALYLTLPENATEASHLKMFNSVALPTDLHSHILSAEVIHTRNDTNTALKGVLEVPRFSALGTDTPFHALASDGQDGCFAVPVNYDGPVLDTYGVNDAHVFDSSVKCSALVGSPEYHRWCNVNNVDALIAGIRASTSIESDDMFAYYVIPLPINGVPTNIAQYMAIQHNIELYEATALMPPFEVHNQHADSKESKQIKKEWENKLEIAVSERHAHRRKLMNRKRKAWKKAMIAFDAKRVEADRLRQAGQDVEIPEDAPPFPEDDMTPEEIEADLIATTHPPPVFTTFVRAQSPSLKKTGDGEFAVRVAVAAMDAMVQHMANLYNPEQTAINKTVMRIRLTSEHPGDVDGNSFQINHKREVLQKRVSPVCINVTVRTKELVYTGHASVDPEILEFERQQNAQSKVAILETAFNSLQELRDVSDGLSDLAAREVEQWHTSASQTVVEKAVLREKSAEFFTHDEANRNYRKQILEKIGHAAHIAKMSHELSTHPLKKEVCAIKDLIGTFAKPRAVESMQTTRQMVGSSVSIPADSDSDSDSESESESESEYESDSAEAKVTVFNPAVEEALAQHEQAQADAHSRVYHYEVPASEPAKAPAPSDNTWLQFTPKTLREIDAIERGDVGKTLEFQVNYRDSLSDNAYTLPLKVAGPAYGTNYTQELADMHKLHSTASGPKYGTNYTRELTDMHKRPATASNQSSSTLQRYGTKYDLDKPDFIPEDDDDAEFARYSSERFSNDVFNAGGRNKGFDPKMLNIDKKGLKLPVAAAPVRAATAAQTLSAQKPLNK